MENKLKKIIANPPVAMFSGGFNFGLKPLSKYVGSLAKIKSLELSFLLKRKKTGKEENPL